MSDIQIKSFLVSSMKDEFRHVLSLGQFTSVEHEKAVRELQPIYNHSIICLDHNPDVTCVPYALGLHENDLYFLIASEIGIFAGRDFMNFLLDGRLKKIEYPYPGALINYFSEERWMHVGKYIGKDRVISKWGTLPVYEHALFEVPIEYGNMIEFYELIDRNEAINYFLDYFEIKNKGADIDSRKRLFMSDG